MNRHLRPVLILTISLVVVQGGSERTRPRHRNHSLPDIMIRYLVGGLSGGVGDDLLAILVEANARRGSLKNG